MTHRFARESGAEGPDPLDAGWFTRKTPAQPDQPVPQDRFREVTDSIDAKLNQFQQSLELMIKLMDERLTSFEARLPPSPAVKAGIHLPSGLPAVQTAIRAKNHDTPLYTRPP